MARPSRAVGLAEGVLIALDAIWANKLRSFLTVLGNVIAITWASAIPARSSTSAATPCSTVAMRSKPMPVSMLGLGRGVSWPSRSW